MLICTRLQQHQRQPQREQPAHDDDGDEAHRAEGLALYVGDAENWTSHLRAGRRRKMKWKARGSGFKHNLYAVWSFSGVWIIVMVLTMPVLTIAMMLGGVVPESTHSDIWFFLLTRVPVIALAAVGLAIFTTNRVAGPFVYLRRSFEAVERGDMIAVYASDARTSICGNSRRPLTR